MITVINYVLQDASGSVSIGIEDGEDVSIIITEDLSKIDHSDFGLLKELRKGRIGDALQVAEWLLDAYKKHNLEAPPEFTRPSIGEYRTTLSQAIGLLNEIRKNGISIGLRDRINMFTDAYNNSEWLGNDPFYQQFTSKE